MKVAEILREGKNKQARIELQDMAERALKTKDSDDIWDFLVAFDQLYRSAAEMFMGTDSVMTMKLLKMVKDGKEFATHTATVKKGQRGNELVDDVKEKFKKKGYKLFDYGDNSGGDFSFIFVRE